MKRNVTIEHAEVALLEDLYGIKADLEWIQEIMWTAARVWEEMMIRRNAEIDAVLRKSDGSTSIATGGSAPLLPIDSLLFEAACTAAVVRYARCFKSGVRFQLPENWVRELGDELREYHKYLLKLRDKHVAHSVNPYEDNRVTAVVPDQLPEGWTIQGLGGGQTRYGVMFSCEEIDLLAQLAQSLTMRVLDEIRVEEQRVLPILNALPREEIQSWQMTGPDSTPRDVVGKPRKRRRGRL